MVGNPETDRLPVAGSISEWPVTREELPIRRAGPTDEAEPRRVTA